MSQENAEAVRRTLAAIDAGDDDAWLSLFSADAEYQLAEEHPESRTCRGIEEIRVYFGEWRSELRDLRFELKEVVERGDLVVATGRVRGIGVGSGLEVAVPLAYVCTFREGQIVRVAEYLDPERALEAVCLLE